MHSCILFNALDSNALDGFFTSSTLLTESSKASSALMSELFMTFSCSFLKKRYSIYWI